MSSRFLSEKEGHSVRCNLLSQRAMDVSRQWRLVELQAISTGNSSILSCLDEVPANKISILHCRLH